jgi:hypothetical protein
MRAAIAQRGTAAGLSRFGRMPSNERLFEVANGMDDFATITFKQGLVGNLLRRLPRRLGVRGCSSIAGS